MNIDVQNHPDRYYRIDGFTVPAAARAEFEAAMRRNLAFIETLPGFLGHVVFEKAEGPTSFDIATIAMWESQEAFVSASEAVGAYYRRIGFDPREALARWGAEAEIGAFSTPLHMQ